MENTHNKSTTFISSIVLSLLLCAMILFAGCNPETPPPSTPPANQFTVEQMQTALINFGQKIENLKTYTGTAGAAHIQGANDNSEIGLPYTLYQNFSNLEHTIDFYYDRAGFPLILDLLVTPVINYVSATDFDLVLSQSYSIEPQTGDVNTYNLTFNFNNTTNTLTGNIIVTNSDHPNDETYGKLSLKLTKNGWTDASLQMKNITSNEPEDYLMLGYLHFTNDTTSDNYIKSCYIIQSLGLVSDPIEAIVEAIEYDTQKYLLTQGTNDLNDTQHTEIVNTYLEQCKNLGTAQ